MRVLVDTSVWIDFLGREASPESGLLARLIEDEVEIVTCGVVIAELFQGLRESRHRNELERQFRDMQCLAPREPDTYFAAAALYRALRERGITVRSTVDCLIVRLAAEGGTFVLAKDRDLSHILASGLSEARGLPAG